MSAHSIPNIPSILSTLSGLVPDEIISAISALTPQKTATTLVIKFLLHLNQQIYHKI
jgi:hypothetical protein